MTRSALPENELERMEALRHYAILDTPPDGSFDDITKLAALLFDVPIAIISMVDTDRIWFKSAFGLSINHYCTGCNLEIAALNHNEFCNVNPRVSQSSPQSKAAA